MNEYVLAFVMAGGRGSRLKILTKHRTKPAVSILGHYRIFDFVATNIANSNIPAMMIAAQFEPLSLLSHVGNGETWGFGREDRMMDIMHPYEKEKKIVRFNGTADCVRKSMDRISKKYNPRIILILGGDHVYHMDYSDFIKKHKMNNSDVTIMASPIEENKVSDFGIMRVDETGKILEFTEKPKDKELIEKFRLTDRLKNSLEIDEKYQFLASMGNYIFFKDKLETFLNDYKKNDFGRHIIPRIKKEGGSLYAYPFKGYWRDVGKIGDYFDCNMDFLSKNPPINFMKNRIKTTSRQLPSLRISRGASVGGSIVARGNEIYSGSQVINSIIGYQNIIDKNVKLSNCILMGGDRNQYYLNNIREYNATVIGKESDLERVIIDRNVKIGENVTLSPKFGSPKKREETLKKIGLNPYREKDGRIEGDFYIEPNRNILVIGKRTGKRKEEVIIPENFKG